MDKKIELLKPQEGKIPYFQMVEEIKKYMSTRPNTKLIVGCDSQKTKNRFCFATAVAVYDPGHGGIFYIRK